MQRFLASLLFAAVFALFTAALVLLWLASELHQNHPHSLGFTSGGLAPLLLIAASVFLLAFLVRWHWRQ